MSEEIDKEEIDQEEGLEENGSGDLNEDDAPDVIEVAEDEVDELDEIDEDELEEVEDFEKEKPPEKGAFMVLGQGDLASNQTNRGADDPGDNTLSEPQFICKYGEMIFVSDRGNHRVLAWDQSPEENGEPATVVLGQEDFADCLENRGMTTTLDEMTSGLGDESLDGFTISKCEEDTLSQPAGIAVIDGKLYVVDSGNHRVLRWGGLPTEDGEAPHLVLGQDNFDCNEANRRGVIGSGSLFFPVGMCSGDDRKVMVADKDNHRILVWKKIPFNNGWNADLCLGQSGMDERQPNRGEFDNVTPDSLSFPTGVFYHAESDRLFVSDQGNNRVLIWNKLPTENGTPADIVLGQADMYSRGVNRTLGSNRSGPDTLYFPTDVVYGKTGLFVSDTGNNRVLYWKDVPAESGQPADAVFGQINFYENKSNRHRECTASTLNDPFGLMLEEDIEEDQLTDMERESEERRKAEQMRRLRGKGASNDDEEDDEPPASLDEEDDDDEVRLERIGGDSGEEGSGRFRLYICDRGNSRILVWNQIPFPATEASPDLEETIEIDHPDTLIGDDDDWYDEEESGEEPTEKIPAV
ncbi:MAG: hypothetical protein COV67_04985 [Nitrospinae bacterium CG11_big_fil_rev_8_21_14_0_20_56_8]|nr:MAG: hypothetical protein COV67_04985 [Nitrospinae bacterium CG11_big_fil_rev_8_21_14_0_20_56_8]